MSGKDGFFLGVGLLIGGGFTTRDLLLRVPRVSSTFGGIGHAR